MNANQLTGLLELQRAAFLADMAPSAEARIDRIDRLAAMTERGRDEIAAAINADFGNRSPHETELAEILAITIAAPRMRGGTSSAG